MRFRLLPLALLALSAALISPPPSFAQNQQTPQSADETPQVLVRNHPRHKAFNNLAQKGGFDVLFIGDSITHQWEYPSGADVWAEKIAPLAAANFGIGGDQTGHVLWRLRNGNLAGQMDPKVVVIMIGTNNAWQKTPARTANGIKAIIGEIRTAKPDAKILLLGIFPRGATPTDHLRQSNEQVNKIIAKFADNQHVFYKDIGKAFLEKNGTLKREIMPDLLHLSPKGYHIWADNVVPTIKKLLPTDRLPAIKKREAEAKVAVAEAIAKRKAQEAEWAKLAPPDRRNAGWVNRAKLLNQRAQDGGFDVMFIGDSITHAWDNPVGKNVWAKKLAQFKPQNFGISGDQTSHVLYRLRNGNLAGKADPKLVVLMIGTNDTGHNKGNQPAEATAAGVKAILDEVQKQKPAAKILVLGIFPRDDKSTGVLRQKNEAINALIAKFADNQKVFYKDIGSVFLQEDGTLPRAIMPDVLHPNEKGYNLWADAIIPDLEKLLK